MTDMGYNFGQTHAEWFDVLRTTKLPAYENQYGTNGNAYFSVRQTRFGIKSFNQTALGELKTIFEFELFGTGVDAGQTTFRFVMHTVNSGNGVWASTGAHSWMLMYSLTLLNTGVPQGWFSSGISRSGICRSREIPGLHLPLKDREQVLIREIYADRIELNNVKAPIRPA